MKNNKKDYVYYYNLYTRWDFVIAIIVLCVLFSVIDIIIDK